MQDFIASYYSILINSWICSHVFARFFFNTWEYTNEKAYVSRYNGEGNVAKKEGQKIRNYLHSEHELDYINIWIYWDKLISHKKDQSFKCQ